MITKILFAMVIGSLAYGLVIMPLIDIWAMRKDETNDKNKL